MTLEALSYGQNSNFSWGACPQTHFVSAKSCAGRMAALNSLYVCPPPPFFNVWIRPWFCKSCMQLSFSFYNDSVEKLGIDEIIAEFTSSSDLDALYHFYPFAYVHYRSPFAHPTTPYNGHLLTFATRLSAIPVGV